MTSAIEVTEFTVLDNQQRAFEEAMATALPLLERQPGHLRHRFGRIPEDPTKYLLLVEWRQLEDHTTRFRNSPDFASFVNRFRPLLRKPARVLHLAPE